VETSDPMSVPHTKVRGASSVVDLHWFCKRSNAPFFLRSRCGICWKGLM
jgi:hypothetical protein